MTFDIDDDPSTTADNSFDVIWGRVDREMYNSGGILTGGGLFSTLMPDSTGGGPSGTGTFEAQSGHWAAVPESSSALLGLMGCTLLLNRRRR